MESSEPDVEFVDFAVEESRIVGTPIAWNKSWRTKLQSQFLFKIASSYQLKTKSEKHHSYILTADVALLVKMVIWFEELGALPNEVR